MEEFSRTELLIGSDALAKLINSKIIIFGIGGVGGYTLEALCRCGIKSFDLVDCDKVSLSNINRQIIALHSTVGEYKTDVAKKRILDINQNASVNTFEVFYSKETEHMFDLKKYDYIVDAIDSVGSKILLIENAKKYNIPIISSMGAGNKLNPTMFEVADIYSTSVCPLARVVRHELKKRNIKDLKVVYSKELPVKNNANKTATNEKIPPASISFTPSVAGLIMACEVIKDLIKI